MYDVYIDIVFFVNFILDFILITLSVKFIKNKIKWRRILLSSFLGGVYSIIVFIPQFYVMSNDIIKLLFPLIMLFISVSGLNIKKLIKLYLVYYCLSLLLSGLIGSVIYFMNADSKDILLYRQGICINITFVKLIVISVSIFFILSLIINKLKNLLLYEGLVCNIEVFHNNNSVKFDGIFDTGNNLKEPFTNKYVLITKLQNIKPVLDDKTYNCFLNCSFDTEDLKIHILPYLSLGNENGIMYGFIPDRVLINNTDCDLIIGVYNGNLNSVDAIVNPCVIT